MAGPPLGDVLAGGGLERPGGEAPSANGDVVVVFEDVAPGAYAFSAMHDVNGDFQMQREENGRPLEGWAMHNGASLRARPTFDAVKIEVGADGLALTEAMIYPR